MHVQVRELPFSPDIRAVVSSVWDILSEYDSERSLPKIIKMSHFAEITTRTSIHDNSTKNVY